MSPKPLPTRAVLLDWDGTLLNSYQADVEAYLAMFRAMKIEWTVREIDQHYSPDWHRVYRAAGIPPVKWADADRLWRKAYSQQSCDLLPGVRSVLSSLQRHFVLGVVTGGSGDRVRRQLQDFKLASHFSTCICSEDTPKRKPHPAPLQWALRCLGARPEECVYVGDTPEDVEMARRARVRAIGVLGPFPTADRVRASLPDVLLRSIGELPKFLRPWADA